MGPSLSEDVTGRRTRILLALVFALFALSRAFAIDSLPIFVDEAKHLHWAQRFRTEWPFLKPLEDGKLLQVAVTSLTLPLAREPLRAARFTSAAVGALGLWAAFCLGRRLRGDRAGLIAALCYLVSPFTLLHDRLNLADVYLSTGAAWVLVATFALIESPGLAPAIGLGLLLAASVLAKATGLVLFAVPIAGVVLSKRRPRPWRSFALAMWIASVLLLWPVLRFFSSSSQLEAKAALVGINRVALLLENSGDAVRWMWTYWTPPLFLLVVAGAVRACFRRRPNELLTVGSGLLPIIAFVPVAFHWYPRYLLFATVPAFALAACALVDLIGWGEARWPRARRLVRLAVLCAVVVPAAAFDVRLLADPTAAPLPEPDGFQYVWGWPSGYGWREAYQHLCVERQKHPEGIRVIADRAGHRTGQWALTAYFMNDPGVEVTGLELRPGQIQRTVRWARERPTYFVTSSRGGPDFSRIPQLVTHPLGVFVKPDGTFVCEVRGVSARRAAATVLLPSRVDPRH